MRPGQGNDGKDVLIHSFGGEYNNVHDEVDVELQMYNTLNIDHTIYKTVVKQIPGLEELVEDRLEAAKRATGRLILRCMTFTSFGRGLY